MFSRTIKKNLDYLPVFFNIQFSKEKNELEPLLKSNPNIEVLVEIYGQLEELLKLKNPKMKFIKEAFHDTLRFPPETSSFRIPVDKTFNIG